MHRSAAKSTLYPSSAPSATAFSSRTSVLTPQCESIKLVHILSLPYGLRSSQSRLAPGTISSLSPDSEKRSAASPFATFAPTIASSAAATAPQNRRSDGYSAGFRFLLSPFSQCGP